MQVPVQVQPPATPILQGPVIIRPGIDGPQAVYRAFNEQRRELANQLESLEERRGNLAGQLANPAADKSLRTGLELRVGELDKRIADVDKQLAAADLAVANAAAAPGAIIPPPPYVRTGPSGAVVALSGGFIVAVLFPIAIALARRIWKRSTGAVSAFPQELADRLNRLDQSMDSIAIEVERIGEGQRFVTRVLSENGRVLGTGAAPPIDVGARGEKAKVPRDSDRL